MNQTSLYNISVTNTGDIPVILELSVTNWSPDVHGVIEWNYNNTAIPVNETIEITLSLIIDYAKTTTFNNDIIITSRNT